MNCREKIASEEYIDFLVKVRDLANIESRYEDICYETVNDEWIVVYVAKSEVLPLSFEKYNYYPIPKLLGLMDQSALVASGVIKVRNQTNLMLTGKGVMVGIIDEEIDYLHEALREDNGSTRILGIWDQEDNSGTLPPGIGYGSEYTKEMINRAISGDEPYDIVPDMSKTGGHGTFAAGIAAGSMTGSGFSGVAPGADIAVVKLRRAKKSLQDFYLINNEARAFSESDVMMGIKYLTELASKNNKPLVIFMGLGTSYGPHTGGTPLSQMIAEVADDAGIVVVVPMGNEGNFRHHFLGAVSGGSDYENVEIRVGENERGFLLELWGQQPDVFSIGIVAPSGEVVAPIRGGVNSGRKIEFVYEETVIYVDYRLIETIEGSQLITMRFEAPTAGIWKIRVYSENLLAGYYNMWLPISEFLSSETYFLRSSPYVTLTQPASVTEPISVGAYNHLNNSIWIDSGRGYSANGVVKPEIVAPGINVYGPLSGANHESYTRKSGTSIAAAFAAGAAALIWEWHIRQVPVAAITTKNIKSLLILGAGRDAVRSYPGPEWGYGYLDVAEIFDRLAGI